ncbi:MAG TPA: SAV_2336 N-terminal domain-related protein [Ktedonobacteraceae bacterium]|nr:SAV_2336 N-terminal domain-related protein [Ktedonobacteraceae bacterium]
MIDKLIAALQHANLEMTAKEVADLLWLALQMNNRRGEASVEPDAVSHQPRYDAPSPAQQLPDATTPPPPQSPPLREEPVANVYLKTQRAHSSGTVQSWAIPFKSPAAPALPHALAIARALRPFMRRFPSKTTFVFNEPATVQKIAETQNSLWAPVVDPLPIRWFDIALVVDEGPSMQLWQQTIVELRTLLEHHGAFRDIRLWRLATDDPDHVQVYAGSSNIKEGRAHSPKELIDPSGRRLILVVTDCVSSAWHNGKVQQILDLWGKKNFVTLIQMFPRRLWHQTALHLADMIRVASPPRNAANIQLKFQPPRHDFDHFSAVDYSFALPIVTLEHRSLLSWANMITGTESTVVPGALFEKDLSSHPDDASSVQQEHVLAAKKRVQLFRANASPTARKLAGLLAAAPIPLNLHVIRLIQHITLPAASPVYIAEVLLGGLLEQIYSDEPIDSFDHAEYDFIAGVRDELLNIVPISDAYTVLKAVSIFVEQQYGQARDFLSLIGAAGLSEQGVAIAEESRPFAQIAATVLRRFGKGFASFAATLEQQMHTLDVQSAAYPSAPGTSSTALSAQQSSLPPMASISPTISVKSFMIKTWCGLEWTDWIPFDASDLKALPTGPGVYRIRGVGGSEIFYIGQTGQNLRICIGDLIFHTMSDPSQMPFSDPHPAAPLLWSWRDATGVNFEYSVAPLTFSAEECAALACYLLWQYRLEQGSSPLCNYDRPHPQYIRSESSSTGLRGLRLAGTLNNARNASFAPLHLIAQPHQNTWMGLQWSNLYAFHILMTQIEHIAPSPGVYKILDADTLQLLCVGSSTQLKTALQNQSRRNWQYPLPVFAFSLLPDETHPYQMAEIENDLIGGYYAQTKTAPAFQFKQHLDNAGEQKESKFDEADITAKILEVRRRINHSTVLVLGSRAGALFRSKNLYETLRLFSNRDFSRLSQTEQFAECYSLLTKNLFSEADIHAILRSSLQDLPVTKGETILAELVKRGYFGEIISTNVDDLLEQAFIQAEMKEGHDFEVIIPGPGASPMPGKTHLPRIIKVFGDFTSRLYTISNRHMHLESHQESERILRSLLERDALILGLDPVWDQELLRIFPNRGGSLWLIDEENQSKHPLISKHLQGRQATFIAGNEGNTEIFLQSLQQSFDTLEGISSQANKDVEAKKRDKYSVPVDGLEIARSLRADKKAPTILFLGSRAGALFRSKDFYERLRQFSNRDFSHLSRIEQFSECHHVLQRHFTASDLHTILQDSLQSLPLLSADIQFADLVKKGIFDIIISTNIDDALENAFLQVGMRGGRDFQVVIPQRDTALAFDRSHEEGKKPYLLVKLFGSFGAHEYEIRRRDSYFKDFEKLKQALAVTLSQETLLIGYDPQWDRSVDMLFPVTGQKIWYVNEDLDEDSQVFHLLQNRSSGHLIGTQGSYEIFIQDLYRYIQSGNHS